MPDARTLPLEEYLHYFELAGGTDKDYLANHYQRFIATHEILKPRLGEKKRVLDIGAHWLHQSLLYALDGHTVIAADFPITLELENVKKLATDNHIALLKYSSLDEGEVFNALRDNQIDGVLFTEIIEHITFNPVAFWQEIYRILSPGGKIVITTPNYYAARGRFFKGLGRVIRGHGGGIAVEDVIGINTYGHHWKEFSAKELAEYFALLSPDFKVSHIDFFSPKNFPSRSLKEKMITRLESSIRQVKSNLYVEIELTKKESGITAKPHW